MCRCCQLDLQIWRCIAWNFISFRFETSCYETRHQASIVLISIEDMYTLKKLVLMISLSLSKLFCTTTPIRYLYTFDILTPLRILLILTYNTQLTQWKLSHSPEDSPSLSIASSNWCLRTGFAIYPCMPAFLHCSSIPCSTSAVTAIIWWRHWLWLK